MVNFVYNFDAGINTESKAGNLRGQSHNLTEKIKSSQLANSLFCFEDQQAYSDSIKSWQNQIDTLNARVERPDKETSEYLSKALVYGYFF